VANSWIIKTGLALAVILAAFALLVTSGLAATQQSGSVGIQGKVLGPPPSRAPTINVPGNGQSFNNLPITVSGFCEAGTLVEIYKNNVFAGSTQCQNGSYRLEIDLFDGRNDLVAREFDDLNQAGPDSNTVTVNFSSPIPSIGPRLSLTSEFSKRGANPGSILTWPIALSGGSGPYAISVDWGDKSKPDLISLQLPGVFNLQHTYSQSGVFNILIRASDSNGNVAFLQVVGVGNGPIKQVGTNSSNGIITKESTKLIWWPIPILFVFIFAAYWLGMQHQLEAIRRRLRKGQDGFGQ
jgi:hypothetical protein